MLGYGLGKEVSGWRLDDVFEGFPVAFRFAGEFEVGFQPYAIDGAIEGFNALANRCPAGFGAPLPFLLGPRFASELFVPLDREFV